MKFMQLLALGHKDEPGSLARTKDWFQCVGLNLNFADTFNAMPSPNQLLRGKCDARTTLGLRCQLK